MKNKWVEKYSFIEFAGVTVNEMSFAPCITLKFKNGHQYNFSYNHTDDFDVDRHIELYIRDYIYTQREKKLKRILNEEKTSI
jgi:hypothetical protein